jgi:Icc protein
MKNANSPVPATPQVSSTDHAETAKLSPNANDGIDRRNFLSCMAWAGTGLLWTMVGGVPTAKLFAATGAAASGGVDHAKAGSGSGFSFVQISDSHIGFNKAANQDVTGTLKLALDKINALPAPPELLLHTGDISHSSKPAEFDTAQQLINGVKVGEAFYVPGEHDIATDDGAMYHERFGKGSQGRGWYSFTHKDVHFIGLNNCQQVDAMGKMGDDQLAWLKSDLASLSASTPIVIFAHIPLWMVYPEWGWGTPDAAEALTYFKWHRRWKATSRSTLLLRLHFPNPRRVRRHTPVQWSFLQAS